MSEDCHSVEDGLKPTPRKCSTEDCDGLIFREVATICISCVNKRMAKCKDENELRELLEKEGV